MKLQSDQTWFNIYIDYCSISVGKYIIPAIVYGFNQKRGFFNSGLASSSKKLNNNRNFE